MYEKLQPLYPEGQANRTDPILRHDTKYGADVIIKQYQPQYNDDATYPATPGMIEDPTSRDAIHFPLVRVNNHVIDKYNIIKCVVHNDRFTPYLELVFKDNGNVIQFSDMPGLDNVVTVVMIEYDKGAHRPIKTNFYTTSCNILNNTFYINAEFKCLPLEALQFKQEVFHYPGEGCKSKFCNLPPNDHPTTYEFLHTVAENCGLGFSATQKCRSIKDDRYRILRKKKYKDIVPEHTACGGLDENSIFDSWIDPWGNLVMVNLPWIMNEDVKPDELGSLVTVGVETTIGNADSTKKTPCMVQRIISNLTLGGPGYNNMIVTDVNKMVDLSSGFYKGTFKEYSTVNPEGQGDSRNQLKTEQIRETESSNAGQNFTDNYEFSSQEFAGFEMSSMTPTISQRHRHDEYFKKHRAHMVKASLLETNFGLERGMLCSLLWFVSDPVKKSIIANTEPNLTESDITSEIKNTVDNDASKIIDREHEPVLDTAISGIYYIDGIDWEYDSELERITQHLYMIKKGNVTEYYDKTNAVRQSATQ